MTSFAMTTQGPLSLVPVLGSPTVALARFAEECRDVRNGVIVREVFPRVACTVALGTALLESYCHAVVCAAVCVGLTGRVLLRVTNRALAGAIGAAWGYVYGGVASFSPTVWLRRVVVYGFFLSRDISVVWRHFLERSVAAGDFAWLGVRMWDLSGRLDVALERGINVRRAGHHCSQSLEFLSFAVTNAVVSMIKPQKTILGVKKQGLGSPIPPLSLSQKTWQFVWKNKAVTMVALGALALAFDYFVVCNSPSPSDFYTKDLPRQGILIRNLTYDYTFGKANKVMDFISKGLDWMEDSRKSMEIRRIKDCLALADTPYACPPSYLKWNSPETPVYETGQQDT